jgi:hypothetical protein
MRMRQDKALPNHMRVYTGTLQTIKENITAEDVCALFSWPVC